MDRQRANSPPCGAVSASNRTTQAIAFRRLCEMLKHRSRKFLTGKRGWSVKHFRRRYMPDDRPCCRTYAIAIAAFRSMIALNPPSYLSWIRRWKRIGGTRTQPRYKGLLISGLTCREALRSEAGQGPSGAYGAGSAGLLTAVQAPCRLTEKIQNGLDESRKD